MAFAAIYIPNFPIQAVVRSEPELAIRPLTLIDGPPPTYSVIATNRLAAHLGVTEGMTKAAAAQFAGMQIRPRGILQESAAHAALLDVAWSFSPRVEDTAPEMLLTDIDGLSVLHGSPQVIAEKIMARCGDVGLSVHVAVAAGVETAQVVARAVPGATVVPNGKEAKFLETLPVEMLSTGAETLDVFQRWGVKNCKDLSSLPVLALSECLGQEGVRLHTIASGKGHRALHIAEPLQAFEEIFELDDAVEDLEPLSFLLGRLLDQLCARIVVRSLSVRAVYVHFVLQPAFENAFDTAREAFRTPQLPGAYACTLELPVPSRDAKLLLKLLRLRLQSLPPNAPVQEIRMRAEAAHARVTQGGLFIPDVPGAEKLELTIARIASVVGEGNVGSPQLLDSHRPDAFRMQRFSVPATEPVADAVKTETRVAFRAFRPPVPAKIKLRGGRPVRVIFQGRAGDVLHASGPWRSSGDWWEDQWWRQDSWDLELHFTCEIPPSQGFYQVYLDFRQKKWFLRGTYD